VIRWKGRGEKGGDATISSTLKEGEEEGVYGGGGKGKRWGGIANAGRRSFSPPLILSQRKKGEYKSSRGRVRESRHLYFVSFITGGGEGEGKRRKKGRRLSLQ